MNDNQSILRSYWQDIFRAPWILGLSLIVIFGIPRFMLVLKANMTGNYNSVSIIFILMWFTPWIFLTPFGRMKIGLKKPDNPKWLIIGFLTGALLCTIMFLLAIHLYNGSVSNWFVYISDSYSILPDHLSSTDKLIYFSIYAGISMIFSPIGEEILYRGIIHECFETKWNNHISSVLDSLAFSLTHLAHFGIVYHLGKWKFLFIPAVMWMILLFISCIIFFLVRKKSGSLLGAILTHAGFNLTMIYFIFYHILKI